jgi:hypothetical protein
VKITSKIASIAVSAALVAVGVGGLPAGVATTPVQSTTAPSTSGWTASINGVTFVPSTNAVHSNVITPDYAPGTIALCNAGFGNVSVESWKNAHGHIDLFCGDSTQGYVHIRTGHQADWQAVITKYPIGGSWDDSMSFATGQAIISGPVYNAGSGKLCYTAPWQIKHNGTVVATYHPTIIISGTRNLVITSYPTHLASEC